MDDFLLIDEEPKKRLTAFQSLGIILAFFVLLVWGSNWKNDKPLVVISADAFIGYTPPPPLLEAKPKKEEKTINEDTKTFEDAEIALKKKQEKDLADDLEKKRKEKECEDKLAKIKGKESKKKDRKKKSCEDELAAAEAAVAAAKAEAAAEERQRLDAAEAAVAAAKAAAAAEERQRLDAAEAERASHLSRMQVYIGRIVGRLEHFVGDVPDSVPLSERNESTVATFVLKLTADGELEDLPEIVESSGYDEYDNEARRAILRAMPLPMPKEPELLESFLNMTIHIDAAGHIN